MPEKTTLIGKVLGSEHFSSHILTCILREDAPSFMEKPADDSVPQQVKESVKRLSEDSPISF
jgi:hypothetical protein